MTEENADQNTHSAESTGCGLSYEHGDGYGMPDYVFDGEGHSAAECSAYLSDEVFSFTYLYQEGHGF